jgi:NADH:ubiquinone oxidoreductase subunit F (NADH-binding)
VSGHVDRTEIPATHPAPAAALGPSLLDVPVVYGPASRQRPMSPDPSGGGLTAATAHDLDAHLARFGARPHADGSSTGALLDALEEVALTGRGGGHFRVAVKWRTAIAAGGGGTVVANAAEGEPASVKDAALLQLRPHLVLDGLALAGEAVDACESVVWLHEGDTATTDAVHRALAQRRARGLREPEVRVVHGPDRYLSGESSAVLRGLSGGPPLPELSRRPAASAGLRGLPTVLQNIESLAMVGLVARWGAAVDGDHTLVTLVGPRHRVVLPLAGGETFDDLLAMVGWSAGTPQAALVGGFGGAWVRWSDLAGLPVSERELRSLGASIGAGVVAPILGTACGLTETARLMSYLATAGARQCGPCVFGLPALADLVDRLAAGRAGRGDMRLLDRYAGEVAGRGACHHPDGAVRLLRSCLDTFAADVRRHLGDGPCPPASAPTRLPVPTVP